MSEYVIHALTTLLVSLEPPGLAPIFIGLSVGMTPAERRKAAFGAATISIVVLLCFAVLGDALLGFLGISLPAFRIAGGLLLFVIAYNMVFAKDEEVRAKPQVAAKNDAIQNIAIFPLAIPIIAGPGAISATIILGSKATNLYQHIACSWSLPSPSAHAWPSCCLQTVSTGFLAKPVVSSLAGYSG